MDFAITPFSSEAVLPLGFLRDFDFSIACSLCFLLPSPLSQVGATVILYRIQYGVPFLREISPDQSCHSLITL